MFLDEAMKVSGCISVFRGGGNETKKLLENNPTATFWTSLGRSLEKCARDASKGSATTIVFRVSLMRKPSLLVFPNDPQLQLSETAALDPRVLREGCGAYGHSLYPSASEVIEPAPRKVRR